MRVDDVLAVHHEDIGAVAFDDCRMLRSFESERTIELGAIAYLEGDFQSARLPSSSSMNESSRGRNWEFRIAFAPANARLSERSLRQLIRIKRNVTTSRVDPTRASPALVRRSE
jgi:hypothetical protein